jgi:DNA-binding winged helix-turn-helix (wHTH) protein
MTHPGRVYSRARLLDDVWGDHVFVEERTVDVHIRRLRLALAPTGHDSRIETVRGVGYRFIGSQQQRKDQAMPVEAVVDLQPRAGHHAERRHPPMPAQAGLRRAGFAAATNGQHRRRAGERKHGFAWSVSR